MYIYICTYIHIYMHIYPYISIYIYVCMYVWMCTLYICVLFLFVYMCLVPLPISSYCFLFTVPMIEFLFLPFSEFLFLPFSECLFLAFSAQTLWQWKKPRSSRKRSWPLPRCMRDKEDCERDCEGG